MFSKQAKTSNVQAMTRKIDKTSWNPRFFSTKLIVYHSGYQFCWKKSWIPWSFVNFTSYGLNDWCFGMFRKPSYLFLFGGFRWERALFSNLCLFWHCHWLDRKLCSITFSKGLKLSCLDLQILKIHQELPELGSVSQPMLQSIPYLYIY